MNKYFKILKYDLKKIYLDKLSLLMLLSPIYYLLMINVLIPFVMTIDAAQGDSVEVIEYTINFLLLVVIGLSAYVNGAILAFTLVELKDEKSIKSIGVTPMSYRGFLMYKSIFTFLLGFVASFILIFGISLNNFYNLDLNMLEIILVSISISLSAPVIGLLIATFAANKVQGYAYMKMGGLILLVPNIIFLDFFKDYKQYIVGIFPNFWSSSAIRVKLPYFESNSYDLSFYGYLITGIIISLVIIYTSIRVFEGKVKK